jgi:hypothetical protein
MGQIIELTAAVQGASQGPAGPSGPPGNTTSTALNITNATVVIGYTINGYGPQLVSFSGIITLPTTAPNYADLAKIVVTATDQNGIGHDICTLTAESWGIATTVAYNNSTASIVIQPTEAQGDQVWQNVTFTCVDANGLVVQNPYQVTSGLTVQYAAITALTFTEIGPRTNTNGSVSSTFSSSLTIRSVGEPVPNPQLPIWITLAVDYNDGTGPQFVQGTLGDGSMPGIPSGGPAGQFYLNAAPGGAVITWQHWVPTSTTQENWTAYAVIGNISANVAIPSGWPSGYVTEELTVTAVAAPLATDVSNAIFVADQNGQDIQYVVNSSGTATWYFTVQWTQPTLAIDPDYWFSLITAQQGYVQTGSGTLSGGSNNILSDSTNPFLKFASILNLAPTTYIHTAGTGYKVGDIVWIAGGTYTTKAAFIVATISGGGSTGPVTSLTLLYQGTYTVAPASVSNTTTLGNGTGLQVHVVYTNQAGNALNPGFDIHITQSGVTYLTTVQTYTSAGQITVAPVAGLVGGACTYEIFNPAPLYTGASAYPIAGTSPFFLGTEVSDSGALSPTGNSIPGTTVQYVRDIDQGWGCPQVNNADGTPNLYVTWRWRCYAGSIALSNPAYVTNSTLVLQTQCWTQSPTVPDHLDVYPNAINNPLDLTTSSPASYNNNLFHINPNGSVPVFDVLPQAITTAYLGMAAVGAAQTNLLAINVANGALAADAAVNNLQQVSYYYLIAIPTIDAAGTGYLVGDTLTLSGGTASTAATFTVGNVSLTGGVTSLTVANAGNYSATSTGTGVATTGGTGSGCTVTLSSATWSTGPTLSINNGVNVFTGAIYLSQGNSNPVVALLNTGIFLYGAAQSSGLPIGSSNPATPLVVSEPFVAIQSTGILAANSATGGAVYIDSGTASVNIYSVQSSAGTGDLTSPFVSINSSSVLVAESNTSACTYITGGTLTLYSVYNSSSHPYVAVSSSGLTVAYSSTGNAVAVGSAGIYLYSVNGNTTAPNSYTLINSSGMAITSYTGSGSNYYGAVFTGSGIALNYNGANYLTMNSTGITLASGPP